MTLNLRDLNDFGEVAAEDDDILLQYFLSTNTVSQIEQGNAFLVLGRKGSGKTAIVRYFTEGNDKKKSKALNLRNYPWNIHSSRIDRGADSVDAYVSSWRYLVAVELASWVLKESAHIFNDHQRPLADFLNENYGGTDPRLADIIRPKRLKVRKFTLSPSVLGNALGSVALDRSESDHNLGLELEALTRSILQDAALVMRECNLGDFFLHFDELDAGLEKLDDTRSRMIIGLILAIRGIRRDLKELEAPVRPVLYLRTDVWDSLAFSDKNKITQGQAKKIDWTSETLKKLINVRLEAKLGNSATWEGVIDDKLMRGSQSKWNHIVARTLRRPRDVIHFLTRIIHEKAAEVA